MTNILSIQGVNKFYGAYQALKEVNLEVKKGSVFGLLASVIFRRKGDCIKR